MNFMKHNSTGTKVLFVLAFSFLASTGALAQDAINKGAWLVGSSSNIGWTNSSATSGGSSSTFYVNLKGGYFFMDNLTGGLDFGLISSSGTSITTIGPFVRYYFAGKFYFGAGFSSTSSSGTSYTRIPFEAGAALFITDNIAVEPSLNFTSYDGGSDLGVRVGFTLYLNRTN